MRRQNNQLYLSEPLHAVHGIYGEPGSGAGLLELTTRSEPNGDHSTHNTSNTSNTTNSITNPITKQQMNRIRAVILPPMAVACAIANKPPAATIPIQD